MGKGKRGRGMKEKEKNGKDKIDREEIEILNFIFSQKSFFSLLFSSLSLHFNSFPLIFSLLIFLQKSEIISFSSPFLIKKYFFLISKILKLTATIGKNNFLSNEKMLKSSETSAMTTSFGENFKIFFLNFLFSFCEKLQKKVFENEIEREKTKKFQRNLLIIKIKNKEKSTKNDNKEEEEEEQREKEKEEEDNQNGEEKDKEQEGEEEGEEEDEEEEEEDVDDKDEINVMDDVDVDEYDDEFEAQESKETMNKIEKETIFPLSSPSFLLNFSSASENEKKIKDILLENKNFLLK